jgi:HAD superfamily hydrolase (TIGR01549 family)
MLNLTKLKAVFFDVDDTLYDQMSIFKRALQRSSIDIGDVSIEMFFKQMRHHSDILWPVYKASEVTIEAMRIMRIKRAGEDYNITMTDDQALQFQVCYEDEQANLIPYPEVIPFMHKLRDHGLTIGLITNGPVIHQTRKIEQFKLHKMVPPELIFISDALGFAKPDLRVFHHVNQKSGFSPDQCCYIGDSWENDIAAPTEIGWQSIWINHRNRVPESKHQPAAVIRSFSELPALFSSV